MTAMTVNPPLSVNKTAIINHLAHHATNGPAYVQLSATKALARITGLYDEARYQAKLTFEAARKAAQDMTEQVKNGVKSGWDTVAQELEDLKTGRTIVTAETLGNYAPAAAAETEAEDEDEEDESANAEDEPP